MRQGYSAPCRQEKPEPIPSRPAHRARDFALSIDREELVPLSAAAAWIASRTGGKRPNISTLHRWASRGCRGIRLETVFVGHARFTSLEAVLRFFHAKPTDQTSVTVVNVKPAVAVTVAEAGDAVSELRRRVFRQR